MMISPVGTRSYADRAATCCSADLEERIERLANLTGPLKIGEVSAIRYCHEVRPRNRLCDVRRACQGNEIIIATEDHRGDVHLGELRQEVVFSYFVRFVPEPVSYSCCFHDALRCP